ncbi:Xylose isomerase-like TIM barrel [Candidatus Sulfopaludibacter sp. SbA4]|nr:Xylose isomerase-like TIM barrel [Candidatus Sulfopaludibacter sp. SbA4]
MKTSRREFLAVSALAPAAGRLMAANAPALRFPTTRRERIAVASYPFRAFLDTPRNRARQPQGRLMDLKEFPGMVVERFQIRNVELLGEHIRISEPGYLEQLLAAVKAAASHVVDIPTGVGGSVYDADAGKRATAVANAKKWVDTATALECPSVRVHLQGARGAKPDAALAAESLGAISQYGAAKGVVINLENDDLTTEDAFFLAKVIDQVDSPWLRALPDFGNSMLGGDEKFNYDAVTAMFHRAYNIAHVKDCEVDGGKVVRVDLARTFAIAKASGYKGYFSIEFEGEGDPYAGTQKLIEDSLECLG